MTFWDGLQGWTLKSYFEYMSIVPLMVTYFLGIIGIVTLIVAIVRRLTGNERSSILSLLGNLALGLGILGAAYSGLNIYIASRAIQGTTLAVMAPSIVCTLIVLTAGLIPWVIAQAGNFGVGKPVR